MIKEIDWLTSLDKRVKKSFIPIIRYEITDTESWFEMPYYYNEFEKFYWRNQYQYF